MQSLEAIFDAFDGWDLANINILEIIILNYI